MRRSRLFWLLPLVLVSFLARSLFITHSPPELFGDELDVGYQAMSLLHTGQDLYRQPLPLYIHSLSEWRAPLLMYATVPSIALFGNSELGVRFPEILLGSLAPLLLFLLVYHSSKSFNLSILASLILALMPWHVHYSRAAFEVVLQLDLLLLGTLLFLKKSYALSTIPYALTLYTYSTAIIFTPLFLLALGYRKPKTLLLFALLCLPIGYQVLFGHAADRFGVVGITSDPVLLQNVSDYRTVDHSLGSRILYNPYTLAAKLVVTNYYRSFSTEFLFNSGDPTLRHGIQFYGNLLPITAIFILLGLPRLVLAKYRLWLWWLLLGSLPTALTTDGGFHSTRLFIQTVPFAVLTAMGLLAMYRALPTPWRRVSVLLVGAVFAWQVFNYLNFYFVQYPIISYRWWHVGYKSAMQTIAKLSPFYDHVFINNTYEPALIRFLFWTNYSPVIFHSNFSQDQPINQVANHYLGFALAPKYYFGTFSPDAKFLDYSQKLTSHSLYLISQRDEIAGNWDWRANPPLGIRVLHTVTAPDGSPLFYLVDRP